MFCCNTIGNIFRIVIVGGCAFAVSCVCVCDSLETKDKERTVNGVQTLQCMHRFQIINVPFTKQTRNNTRTNRLDSIRIE